MRSNRILMVENDKHLRVSRTRSLGQQGYHVASVSGVEEAAEVAKQPYELVIIGTKEPELLEMLLAQFPPETNFLIIATEDTINRAVECSGVGICSFLIEPVSMPKFRDSVAQTIDKAHLLREGLWNKILMTVDKASRLVAAEVAVDDIFRLVVEISAAHTNADHVSLAIKDETTGKLVIKAQEGACEPTWGRIGQLLTKVEEPMSLEGTSWHHPGLCRSMTGAGIAALLWIPLVNKRDVIGALNHIKVSKRARFTSSDLKFASILGSCCSMALENTRLHSSLERQHLHVEKLMHEVSFAQENERKRVAMQLHDGVAQWMVAASHSLKACSTLSAQSRFDDLELELERTKQTLQKSIRELRRAIANLRPLPLEEVGLIAAIRQATEVLAEEGIRCRAEVTGKLPKLTPTEETTTYWIVQEALTNIRNHSKATDVRLRMQFRDTAVSVEISDNGQGFDAEQVMCTKTVPEHMGLLGINDRVELLGGSLNITSCPGQGTSLVFSFPLLSRVPVKA